MRGVWVWARYLVISSECCLQKNKKKKITGSYTKVNPKINSIFKNYTQRHTASSSFIISLKKHKLDKRITALLTNMRILKFKSQLTIAFFITVNHLNGSLRKQNFTLTGSKGHGLWFVNFDPFCVFLRFKVRWLWSSLWLTAAKNAIVKAAYEL